MHSHTICYYLLPSVNSQTLTDHTHYHACSIQALEWLRLQSLLLFCCTYTTYPLASQHCLTNHDLHSMILTPCLPLDNWQAANCHQIQPLSFSYHHPTLTCLVSNLTCHHLTPPAITYPHLSPLALTWHHLTPVAITYPKLSWFTPNLPQFALTCHH